MRDPSDAGGIVACSENVMIVLYSDNNQKKVIFCVFMGEDGRHSHKEIVITQAYLVTA